MTRLFGCALAALLALAACGTVGPPVRSVETGPAKVAPAPSAGESHADPNAVPAEPKP